MRTTRFFALALLLPTLVAAHTFAAEQAIPLPPGVTRGPSVEGITEYGLANGLRVLFAPDASKPTTTVNTTYLVGSRNENYGETGMAHLLEHLMFKGTPTIPNPKADLTSRGLNFNGSTTQDRTNYFASFAANEANLEWYVRWSADAMTHSFIAKKDLDSEMTVVRNELERGENEPFRVLLQRVQAAAYDWHNYGKSTIGARIDVEKVSIERLRAFYRTYYQPDNAVVVVSGQFDEAKTLALIVNTYGKISRPARKLQPTYTLDSPQDGERSVVVHRVGDTQLVMTVYHVMAGSMPEFADVEVLAQIMGDTPSGRLHKALVETRQAAEVFAFPLTATEPTLLLFGAVLPNDASIDQVRAALAKTVEGVAEHSITADEVERARTKLLKNFELTVNDPQRLGIALSGAIALGDWRLFFLRRDRLRHVKAEDVQRVAAAYLLPDNRTVGLFVPVAQPHRAPAPALADVALMVKDYRGEAAVSAGEAFDVAPLAIEARTERGALANGMKFALLSKRTRGSTVHVALRLHFGDEKSLAGTSPLGPFMASMFNRGAAGMTREQIEDRFDKLKARVSFSGRADATAVSIETTRENLAASLQLVADILRKPSFPTNEIEMLKTEWLTDIEAQRKEPNAIAQLALDRHDNPYPRGDIRYEEDFDESAAAVKTVTRERIDAFYRDYVGADHGEIAIVGDFDAPGSKQLLGKLFGDWKSVKPYTHLPQPPYPMSPAELKFETPDKANAVYKASMHFPLQDSDADYAALVMADHLVGGGASSRLWKRIRETEGLSYSVGSGVEVSSHERSASWSVAAIYAPQNLERFRSALREELERALREGFTAEELKGGKTGIMQARRLARAQDGALAGGLASQLELGRTMTFSAEIDRKIEGLSLEQVNAAARKYFDPAKLVSSVAGDFAKTAAAK